jgi:hypothetical protein
LSSTWGSRFSDNPAHANGTIAADGSVTLGLEGFKQDGGPLGGKMNGNWADNMISVTGNWSNGAPVTANWTRAR